ncbi:MAG: GxxExxY protein [Saprospiraceae bacterium]|uniref:GxxExxY protein n=1 Tax=Candidatus Defluviibacterium haderslevense TaxID=2981993 RepID=A0A9D7SAE9_9BACT|nr:GxxExxY protein [Candidatus Defluviibacterium haderslevense]
MKFEALTGSIINCAMEVHNILGSACPTESLRRGFQEVIYQRALEEEFRLRNIDFIREFEMDINYKSVLIGTRRVDFFVEGQISVELKAITLLENLHLAQAMNYLEAYNLEIGLLINFGNSKLQFHRLTNKKYVPK